MPFIGNQPAEAFSSFQKQDFTTSATTSYTLDHPVANQNEIALFINFVRQEPTTAYTASGTSLTLTSATASSDDMYCVFLGKAVQTVNPPNGSVGLSQLSATGTKDSTTFLRGDNTFASAGGENTPSFEATLSANQSISANTWTKLQLNTESFDSDSCYDNSTNYRFTPTSAGKYFCYGTFYLLCSSSTDFLTQCRILKNGDTSNGAIESGSRNSTDDVLTIQAHSIVTLNGSSDYVEFWVYQNEYGAQGSYNARGNSSGRQFCNFGAYKIIGA